MLWNDHSRDIPPGSHALLGASDYTWLNYDEDKIIRRYVNRYAQSIGTHLHAFACFLIEHNMKLSKADRKLMYVWLLEKGVPQNVIDVDQYFDTVREYVKDAINYRMRPEQPLKYSNNCFGTTDAINFDERTGKLKIFDLKTGTGSVSLHQLEIYDALFCLEYKVKPAEIEHELRIYQNGDVLIGEPTADDIIPIMDKIVAFDKLLKEFKES